MWFFGTVAEAAEEAAVHAADVAAGAEVAHEVGHTGIHVALAAEKLGTFLGFPITNTLLTTWATMAIMILVAYLVGRRLSLVPGKTQLVFEEAISYLRTFVRDTLGSESQANKFLPLLLTLFFFIFISNSLHFVPGIGSIGFFTDHGFVSLFRSANTDLNVTLALTIISVVIIEIAGVVALGILPYLGKFFNFTSPVAFFVGLVELVSEMARLVSFSFRLFGNIFAGEVLIAVVVFFVPYILPSGLMAFELFVGFVQAAIFTLLTLFFIKMAVTPVDAHH